MEILNPMYKTRAIESVKPEWKIIARAGIMKTIIEEYIGFLQRANGPLVISLPGWKYFKKYTAEYTQKINPNPNKTIPGTLNRRRSRNLRSKNSGYLIIIIKERIMYGRHKRASLGPHPKSVIVFFIFLTNLI